MNNRIRYTTGEVSRNIFYQMPKFLFDGEFKDLGNDARVLYSLLRDRHDLSLKNGWVNENNEVYLIFTRENMCEILGLTDKTVTKIVNDLKEFALIEEQRLGQGRPNRIYLLNPEIPINTRTRKISESLVGNFPSHNSENFPPNDTDSRETNLNDTESNQIKSNRFASEENSKNKTDEIRCDENISRPVEATRTEGGQKKESHPTTSTNQSETSLVNPPTKYSLSQVVEIVKDNIDYDCLLGDRVVGAEALDEIVHVIGSTICADFKDGYISMGEEKMPAEAVKSVFFKLNMMDIQYFVRCFKKQTEPITKLTSYIRTSLFRNYGTASHYWLNRVNVDFAR